MPSSNRISTSRKRERLRPERRLPCTRRRYLGAKRSVSCGDASRGRRCGLSAEHQLWHLRTLPRLGGQPVLECALGTGGGAGTDFVRRRRRWRSGGLRQLQQLQSAQLGIAMNGFSSTPWNVSVGERIFITAVTTKARQPSRANSRATGTPCRPFSDHLASAADSGATVEQSLRTESCQRRSIPTQ